MPKSIKRNQDNKTLYGGTTSCDSMTALPYSEHYAKIELGFEILNEQ
jgi:hypothetical protein